MFVQAKATAHSQFLQAFCLTDTLTKQQQLIWKHTGNNALNDVQCMWSVK